MAAETHLAAQLRNRARRHADYLTRWLQQPGRPLVASFLGISLVGACLLAMPVSQSRPIAFVDAAFTAVSAVCVTGLTVVETANAYSPWGQAVILLLIQAGGLGIMTLSAATLLALSLRPSLSHERALVSIWRPEDRASLRRSIRSILLLTFVTEGLGAVVLVGAFVAHGDSLGTALWRGVFTAVSAFCNAGFAPQPGSLTAYQNAPLVVTVTGALIVLGGLSPMAIFALPAMVKRRTRPAAVQARICVFAALALLIVGTVAILALEWSHAFREKPWPERLMHAVFYSVTPRTAGFYLMPPDALRGPTLSLLMALMVIGGSPGSTSGGIKTTTAVVALLAVLQLRHRQGPPTILGRTLGWQSIRQALVVVSVALFSGLGFVLGLQLLSQLPFRALLFEVVSALGTVGLSLGVTPMLGTGGKCLIMAAMFSGRLGSLTLLSAVGRKRQKPELGHPEARIDIG